MAKYIDADVMALDESEAYMSAQTKIEDPILLGLNRVVHSKIQKLIAEAPTVDAVEVVRCRDCKYYYDYGVNRDYCCNRSKYGKQVFDVKFKADDFCSYGERKEGAD